MTDGIFFIPLRQLFHNCRHTGAGGSCPPPLGAYSLTQNSAKNAPKHVINNTQNPKIFWGWGTALLPDPFPVRRGHPSPYLTPQVPPLQLDPG